MTLKEKILMAYGTQRAFAKVVGVDERTVKRWVKADSIPLGTNKAFMAKEQLKAAFTNAAVNAYGFTEEEAEFCEINTDFLFKVVDLIDEILKCYQEAEDKS